ncbi:hypothetical protein [Streptomyces sp. NBC_01716]|uniref:hypothetical protein n=1 Tax=Streptomyces sp. NBC_01716 TaxID=2975917 RepID=UPI002E378F7F|nr:hypothetical protein [Streptomyces sp. NBC_01716]
MTIPPPLPTTPPTPPQPARPSRRRTLTTGLTGALIGAAIVGATWYGTSNDKPATAGSTTKPKPAADDQPDTFALTGDFTLTEGATPDDLGGCEGTGGYADISLGTSITVYDAAGAVIATDMLLLSEYDTGSCTFDINVEEVPTGHEFYQVEIGHRGKIQLSAAEAEAGEFGGTLG